MLVVLGLAGAQAALFGPAKLGSIPEMVDDSRISAANGLIGLTTVFSTMVGTFVGSWLADFTGDKGQEHWQWSAVVLLGVAVAGLGDEPAHRTLSAGAIRRDAFPGTWPNRAGAI